MTQLITKDNTNHQPASNVADPITVDWFQSTNLWPYWQETIYPTYVPAPIYPISHVQPLTFQFTTSRCAWCQGTHIGTCDRLKSVSYRPDGTVERVEFFKEGDKQ